MVLKDKKRKRDFCLVRFYACFLSISKASTTPTMMITKSRATVAGTKYMLATDVGVAEGTAVDCGAGRTLKESSDDEGQ